MSKNIRMRATTIVSILNLPACDLGVCFALVKELILVERDFVNEDRGAIRDIKPKAVKDQEECEEDCEKGEGIHLCR